MGFHDDPKPNAIVPIQGQICSMPPDVFAHEQPFGGYLRLQLEFPGRSCQVNGQSWNELIKVDGCKMSMSMASLEVLTAVRNILLPTAGAQQRTVNRIIAAQIMQAFDTENPSADILNGSAVTMSLSQGAGVLRTSPYLADDLRKVHVSEELEAMVVRLVGETSFKSGKLDASSRHCHKEKDGNRQLGAVGQNRELIHEKTSGADIGAKLERAQVLETPPRLAHVKRERGIGEKTPAQVLSTLTAEYNRCYRDANRAEGVKDVEKDINWPRDDGRRLENIETLPSPGWTIAGATESSDPTAKPATEQRGSGNKVAKRCTRRCNAFRRERTTDEKGSFLDDTVSNRGPSTRSSIPVPVTPSRRKGESTAGKKRRRRDSGETHEREGDENGPPMPLPRGIYAESKTSEVAQTVGLRLRLGSFSVNGERCEGRKRCTLIHGVPHNRWSVAALTSLRDDFALGLAGSTPVRNVVAAKAFLIWLRRRRVSDVSDGDIVHVSQISATPGGGVAREIIMTAGDLRKICDETSETVQACVSDVDKNDGLAEDEWPRPLSRTTRCRRIQNGVDLVLQDGVVDGSWTATRCRGKANVPSCSRSREKGVLPRCLRDAATTSRAAQSGEEVPVVTWSNGASFP